MTWNQIDHVVEEDVWTRDYIREILSSDMPELPPRAQKFGNVRVSWQEIDPDIVTVRTVGGNVEDRTLAFYVVSHQLKLCEKELAEFVFYANEDSFNQWTPGKPGKALIDPEGNIHTWNVDKEGLNGNPHHVDYLESYLGRPVDDDYRYQSEFFDISPDGVVDGVGDRGEDQIAEAIGGRLADDHWTFSKTAGWDDIMAKARRLIQAGNVTLLRNGQNVIVGHVVGDHGQYQTEISRDDPESQTISMWDCDCPWSDYSWGRTRKWKKYEGRPCAHTLATWWLAQSTPLDEEVGPGGTPSDQGALFDPGTAQPGPKAPAPKPQPQQQPQQPQGPGQLSIPGVTPPGEAPPGPEILPPFPGSPEAQPAVSVPGLRQPTPYDPIQHPGGTFSRVADWDFRERPREGEGYKYVWSDSIQQGMLSDLVDQWDNEYHHNLSDVLGGEDTHGGVVTPSGLISVYNWPQKTQLGGVDQDTIDENRYPSAMIRWLQSELGSNVRPPRTQEELWEANQIGTHLSKVAMDSWEASDWDFSGTPAGGGKFVWDDFSKQGNYGGVNAHHFDLKKIIGVMTHQGTFTHDGIVWMYPETTEAPPDMIKWLKRDVHPDARLPATQEEADRADAWGWHIAKMAKQGDQFENSDMVRLEKEEYGIMEGKSEEHGAGQYKLIPENSIGEVLGQDPTTGWVDVNFPLHDMGPMEPYSVRAWIEPKNLTPMPKVQKPGPFIKRRTARIAYDLSGWGTYKWAWIEGLPVEQWTDVETGEGEEFRAHFDIIDDLLIDQADYRKARSSIFPDIGRNEYIMEALEATGRKWAVGLDNEIGAKGSNTSIQDVIDATGIDPFENKGDVYGFGQSWTF